MLAPVSRRSFLATAAATAAVASGALWLPGSSTACAQEVGERPKRPAGVRVLNPRTRVPLSLIIDDSTCLANLSYFAIPQFAEVFPSQYKQDWRKLAREIPDSFVRKFGEWCHAHGVKGKYSIVPYPACVGWIDRDLPGWPQHELKASLELVRTLMAPDWDFHPEMVSHTWAINTRTGRPYPERTEKYMENWGFSVGKSTDELTDYLSFALGILKGAGLKCEGITTPGGFGNKVIPQLAQATLQSCRDIFQAEIPHYFRFLYTDERSVAPQVQYASGLETSDPRCVVSIIGCTGDWFGGWDGLEIGSPDQFITEDHRAGRLPQIIARGEPTILVSHWPGMYANGDESGFKILQEVVARLDAAYHDTQWMKLSEISRYWAAKELTGIRAAGNQLELSAPFASPQFTIEAKATGEMPPKLTVKGEQRPLRKVEKRFDLDSGSFCIEQSNCICCFDLPKGKSTLENVTA